MLCVTADMHLASALGSSPWPLSGSQIPVRSSIHFVASCNRLVMNDARWNCVHAVELNSTECLFSLKLRVLQKLLRKQLRRRVKHTHHPKAHKPPPNNGLGAIANNQSQVELDRSFVPPVICGFLKAQVHATLPPPSSDYFDTYTEHSNQPPELPAICRSGGPMAQKVCQAIMLIL